MTTDYDHDDVAPILREIEHLKEANEALRQSVSSLEVDCDRRLVRLEERLPPTLQGGMLPPKVELSRLECQIFHTPNLSAAERKTKTIWSLRLTAWVKGKRLRPDINVRLYPGPKFYLQAQNRSEVPSALDRFSTNFRSDQTTLLGMLQHVTKGSGRPYCPDQFCAVEADALTGFRPAVAVVIGTDIVCFPAIRPGIGQKEGHAMWYLDWQQEP